jgi:two-component system sensor histidine kinase RegB
VAKKTNTTSKLPGPPGFDREVPLPGRALFGLRIGLAMGLVIGAFGAFEARIPIALAPEWAITSAALIGLSSWWAARRPNLADTTVLGLLVLDTLLFTGTLAASGGASNPLSNLTLIPVVLAALRLHGLAAWAVWGIVGAAYLALLLYGPPPAHHHDADAMKHHLQGMFIATILAGAFLIFASERVRRVRISAEQRMLQAHSWEAQNTRLNALAALAGGAAHELATPLSNIQLIARELREQSQSLDPHHLRQELCAIETEVGRCTDALAALTEENGGGMGEHPLQIDLADLAAEALEGWQGPQVQVEAHGEARLPVRLLSVALRRLFGNAREAGARTITLHANVAPEAVTLRVSDDGSGMNPETLRQATEPFFSTRQSHGGRGLGLFYVRTVAERLGGRFELASEPGKGTDATLHLPTTPPRVR